MAEIDNGTLPIPCPNCGEISNEPINRVATNDVIPCSLCCGLIDLAAEDCRLLVKKAKGTFSKSETTP